MMLHEASLPRRFWRYQTERFPLLSYAVLMAASAAGAIGWARAARGATEPYAWAAVGVAFVGIFGFFFQLRVADEYKDYATDLAHRPYRPVPRGLIRPAELGALAVGVGIVQAILSYWLEPRLCLILSAVWGYMLLMRWEFGVEAWLHRQPLLYMFSHMVILPLIFVYATACDWLVAGAGAPMGLVRLLAAAYASGMVVEVGRKLRSPADEEPGVETYSGLWGIPRATAVWWAAVALAGVCATQAAQVAGDWGVMGRVAVVSTALAAVAGVAFVRRPTRAGSKRLELVSAGWMLACYGTLAILPFWA